MTVLQVGSSLHDWGGIERYVAYLHEGLTARDHEVMVTCPPGSPLARRVPSGVVPTTLRGKFNPAAALPYLRLFRSRRFDVVHVHFSPDFFMPAWAARVTRQPLVVMTRHLALPWKPRKVRMYTRLYDRFIAVSGSVRSHLVESGVPGDRVVVAKAGVPTMSPAQPAEATRRELGIEPGDRAFGFFGRLASEKGVDVLADAADRLPEGTSVQVFGRGPLEERLRGRASARFVLRGYVENVADAMAAMDAVVVPSVWEEAFPYSVLEAMALGKAVIASNVGGLPEIVSEATGLLVPKADPEALARAMTRLDRESLAELGARGGEIQRGEYTIPRMAERVEAVYRR